MAQTKHPLHARVKARFTGLAQGIRRWRHERILDQYIAELKRSDAEVLVLPNFLRLGGIKQHLEAIVRYSASKTELLPGESVLSNYSRHEIETRLSASLEQARPASLRAVHTHVFPWAIRWGRRQQQLGLRWLHTYHPLYTQADSVGEMPPWQREFNAAQLREARFADVRISVANWQREMLEQEHGITSIYLPNGVDVEKCDSASGTRFRQLYRIEDDFVLYIGRDDPVKNPAEFARLAAAVPELRFVMVGRSLNAGYLREQGRVDSPPNLSFIPEVPHAVALDVIAACSALVVTSKREGLPTLVLEAMTMQKPVVAPFEPGCAEALGAGKYGFLYQPGDVADLKRNLLLALRDCDKTHSARQRILEHYDWRIVASQLDKLYQSGARAHQLVTI
jgi:glycosyltransferase involved in cell wall biosynthesis